MNIKFRKLLTLIMLMALTSLACNALSGLGGGDEPAANNGSTNTAQATVASGEANTSGNTAAPNNTATDGTSTDAGASADTSATEGPQSLDFTSVGSALEGADSYRLSLEMTFESSTTDEMGRLFATINHSSDPSATETTMSVESDDPALADLSSFSLIQIENTIYTVAPGIGCFSTDANSTFGDAVDTNPFGDLLASDELVGNINGATRVLPDETINGEDTYHFVFDDSAFSNSPSNDFTDIDGHLYVAKETNALVRLSMDGLGTADFFGSGTEEGMVHIEINVLNINQPVTISPPSDCSAGFDPSGLLGGGSEDGDLYPLGSIHPVFPDNHDLFVSNDITSFQTEAEFDEVVSFYQEQMLEAGYEVVQEGTVLTTDAAVLKYSKDGQTFFVTISQSGETVFAQIVPE